jgi:hypothetical protein
VRGHHQAPHHQQRGGQVALLPSLQHACAAGVGCADRAGRAALPRPATCPCLCLPGACRGLAAPLLMPPAPKGLGIQELLDHTVTQQNKDMLKYWTSQLNKTISG